jgi:hypothetical protein
LASLRSSYHDDHMYRYALEALVTHCLAKFPAVYAAPTQDKTGYARRPRARIPANCDQRVWIIQRSEAGARNAQLSLQHRHHLRPFEPSDIDTGLLLFWTYEARSLTREKNRQVHWLAAILDSCGYKADHRKAVRRIQESFGTGTMHWQT